MKERNGFVILLVLSSVFPALPARADFSIESWRPPTSRDVAYGPTESLMGGQAGAPADANRLLIGTNKPLLDVAGSWQEASSACKNACDAYREVKVGAEDARRKAMQAEKTLMSGQACPALASVLSQDLQSRLDLLKRAPQQIGENIKEAGSQQVAGANTALGTQAVMLPGTANSGAGREEEVIAAALKTAAELQQASAALSARPEPACKQLGSKLKPDAQAMSDEARDFQRRTNRVRTSAYNCVNAWNRGKIAEGKSGEFGGIGTSGFTPPAMDRIANAGSFACTASGYSQARAGNAAKSVKEAEKLQKDNNKRLRELASDGQSKGDNVANAKSLEGGLDIGPENRGDKKLPPPWTRQDALNVKAYGETKDTNRDRWTAKGVGNIAGKEFKLGPNSVAVTESFAKANGLVPGGPVKVNGHYLGDWHDTVPEVVPQGEPGAGNVLPPTIDLYNGGNNKWLSNFAKFFPAGTYTVSGGN